ncbi:MAG: glycosyltransferase family 4 protein [Candidatus Beckwithbacteria bacterium]|nr:glycosyltransferase family 4 protein [Candidatus Beckwithbacteria bacterium]
MNLVFICDAWQPLIGGGQKLFWELTSRLVKDHHCQITVVTRTLRYEGKIFANNETYFNNRLKIIRLGPALPFFNPLGRFWFIIQSFFYCLKFKPDIFLASTWLPAITLQLIKLVKKTPVVLVAIGFGSRLQWLERLITQKFKYNLVITDDLTLKDAKFIPNGVSLPRVASGEVGAKWGNFTFLTVARNEPRKGIPVLQEAFSLVQKQFPQTKLHLFGPGFKVLSQADLDKELFRAHCLVLPSLAEGHPLILFEAWAHQLPVIATQVGSVAKFVNQANGYLVPAGDAPALARTMKLALQNPSLAVMGENGYQLVSKNYSWSKTASRYYQAFKKVRPYKV